MRIKMPNFKITYTPVRRLLNHLKPDEPLKLSPIYKTRDWPFPYFLKYHGKPYFVRDYYAPIPRDPHAYWELGGVDTPKIWAREHEISPAITPIYDEVFDWIENKSPHTDDLSPILEFFYHAQS
jgi:hypothetical protein